jgi:hypothetical protein
MKKIILYTCLCILIIPQITFAFDWSSSTFKDLVESSTGALNIIITILYSVAFISFFWGLSKFILGNTGNQADLKKGKDYMLYSILALFILVSFQAIIGLVSSGVDIKSPANTGPNWRPTLPSN